MSEDNPYDINTGRQLSGNGGSGLTIPERLVRIETKMENMATKEDIQKIKVWILAGVLGGIGMATLVILALARLIIPPLLGTD